MRVRLTAKHIAALKRARKAIARKDEGYICVALRDENGSEGLEDRIAELLAPYSSLDGWLSDWLSVIKRKPRIQGWQLSDTNLRLYRLRWIDHMIATREL